MYKESCFNIVIHDDGNSLYVFNSFSGAFVRIEKNVYNRIHNRQFNEDVPYFNELKNNGIIVQWEFNEVNKLFIQSKADSFNVKSEELSLVIAPTLLCNLSCDYCFEKYKAPYMMTKELQDNVVNFIANKVSPITKVIKINWFGGEPLLCLETIQYVTRKLTSVLTNKAINFQPNITTNGILLTNKTCSILNDCGIKSVQITIDGDSEYYCKVKHAKDSEFYNLLDNINTALNYFNVKIRLNCSKENYESIKSVILKIYNACKLNKNIARLSLYPAQVIDYTSSNSCNVYDVREFSAVKWEIECYINAVFKRKNVRPTIPRYRKNFCGALRINNCVIGPHGELYKCEHFLGEDDRIIGDIVNGYYNNEPFIKFMENSYLPECSTCKLLPICAGSCQVHRNLFKYPLCCCITEDYLKELLTTYIKQS